MNNKPIPKDSIVSTYPAFMQFVSSDGKQMILVNPNQVNYIECPPGTDGVVHFQSGVILRVAVDKSLTIEDEAELKRDIIEQALLNLDPKKLGEN